MTEPHEVLGLDSGADSAAVRRRYLELVRQFPPDREPERFAAVRNAYDQLRDPRARMQKRLFEIAPRESLEEISAEIGERYRGARIPVDALLSLAEPT